MNTKLLVVLEWFLGVYLTSLNSSNLQMAGGCHIYVGLQVVEPLLQRLAEICVPSDEPMPLPGVASVHPVTLRSEVAIELSDALFADVITPVLCSDASPVHPVLKDLLLSA